MTDTTAAAPVVGAQTTPAQPDDRDLKARHRAMWALGDYPSVADTLIPELGRLLTTACRLGPGDRVLDIAAGSGNAAVPAAEAGAEVVATDLTPELLEAGRAAAGPLPITWQEADAEALPFEDAAFDAAISCVGVMFAPHHRAAADELLRVCRPGGRIGLVSWTPEGFLGEMFRAMKPYLPTPPPGVQPAVLWGDEQHVRDLLGEGARDLEATRRTVRITAFGSPAEFREFFATRYGPTIAAYRSCGGDAERVAALDRDLETLAAAHMDGAGAMEWEYLLVTAVRR